MRVQELAERIERAQANPKELALVLTDALNEARGDLVAEATLVREMGSLRSEVAAFRGEMERELKLIRDELAQEARLLRSEMAAGEQRLDAKLEKALRDQTKWIAGIVIAAVGLLGAILKLL